MRKTLSLLLATVAIITSCFMGCLKKENIRLGNVLIFGDSYSTFADYIPEGYASWYFEDVDYTNVNSAKQTWWHQLIDRTYSQLLLNSSYSGSTICHTGYNGDDYSQISFVARMENLFAQKDFNCQAVDTVFIYGGLNDYWAGSPLGEIKYENFIKNDLYSVYPAFSYLVSSLKTNLPNARIIVIIEEYLSEDMKDSFALISKNLSVEYVKPQNISKENSHPDLLGMDQLTNQIIEYLKESP